MFSRKEFGFKTAIFAILKEGVKVRRLLETERSCDLPEIAKEKYWSILWFATTGRLLISKNVFGNMNFCNFKKMFLKILILENVLNFDLHFWKFSEKSKL